MMTDGKEIRAENRHRIFFGTSRHDGLVWYRPPANGLALPFFLLLALMTALAVGL
jgi:hypothetical protein